MEHISSAAGAPKPVGPYSQAVKSSNLVFCAGQIGIDPTTSQLVQGGIEAQVNQTLANLGAVLRACGSSPAEIVMTTIFLAAMSDGPLVNQLYAQFVNTEAPPARQTIAVKELPMGALIEISVIAAAK